MFTQTRIINHPGEAHAPLATGWMYEFLIAGNGEFVHAERPGLKAVIPNGSSNRPDLPHIEPYVRVDQKYPDWMMDEILKMARKRGEFEYLFALQPDSIMVPAQEATAGTVRPINPYDVIMASTLCELHSHHRMEARFSPTDDKEETGFRIYAVIGRIYTEPEIRVRVGIYGNMWEIPASTVFQSLGPFKDALR